MASRWDETAAPRGDEYDAQWDRLAAEGKDPHGEVAFVQRFTPSSVLDAGCGTGRVAIELERRGVTAVGVDLDRRMLDTARRKGAGIEWHEVDLVDLDIRDASGHRRQFDVAVAAGNVMIFLHPGSEGRVVARLAEHLVPGGRLIAGFQLGAKLTLDAYDAAARDAGLTLEHRFATWDGADFVPPGDYAVSVHRRPA
jgi:SAM-dependent methyltransferase